VVKTLGLAPGSYPAEKHAGRSLGTRLALEQWNYEQGLRFSPTSEIDL